MRFLPWFTPSLAVFALFGCSDPSSDDGSDDKKNPNCEGKCDSPYYDEAPLAVATGPYSVMKGEYRLAPSVDPTILGDRETEIWGRVIRPTEAGDAPHPVLVFLHGNHSTCGIGSNPRDDTNSEYSELGTCPDGYEVVPNHAGYDYLAEHMASWGYVVVSINANRGITASWGVDGDWGLNKARGRLVLKHLELLSKWNATPDTTPTSLGADLHNTLDFSAVGMMGHSRGGEGVRAAYTMYHEANSEWPSRIASPLKVRGIFEIGPVDGQTDQVFDAINTAWTVLLPMCDGDVSDLQGMGPFDRMLSYGYESNPAPKSMVAVWGTNHNFFNTEWQIDDSMGCSGFGHKPIYESYDQAKGLRLAGLAMLSAFFRAHVGAEANLAYGQTFDPQYSLQSILTDVTRYNRSYSDSSVETEKIVLDDFTGDRYHVPIGSTINHETVPEHPYIDQAARIEWTSNNDSVSLIWGADGTGSDGGFDLSAMTTLTFRVSRTSSELNAPESPTEFSIALLDDNNAPSVPVSLRDYLDLVGPVGGEYDVHYILDTVRVPLIAFEGIDRTRVRGVRLIFNGTEKGSIYFAQVRAVKALDLSGTVSPQDTDPLVADDATIPVGNDVVHTDGNDIAIGDGAGETVEMVFSSLAPFWTTNLIPVLKIGTEEFRISGYVRGDEKIAFRVPRADYERLLRQTPEADVRVVYGEAANEQWTFGPLREYAK